MNPKYLFKGLFILIVLLLLVMMGLHNGAPVTVRLPPLMPAVSVKGALAYFAFFALGFLTAVIIMDRGPGRAAPPKSRK